MVQIKIEGKTLIVEDGADVTVDGDEIRVKPHAPAPPPVFIPFSVPASPWTPVNPQPYNPWYTSSPTSASPFPNAPTIRCEGQMTSNLYALDAEGNSPYVLRTVRTS